LIGNSLIKIGRNAFGKNIPNQETIMTEEHEILYKNIFVHAYELLNRGISKNITRIRYTGETLYNILMETHDVVLANNMPVETLHPENLIAKLYRDSNYDKLPRLEKLEHIEKINEIMKSAIEKKYTIKVPEKKQIQK
jgi:hypothetical protein